MEYASWTPPFTSEENWGTPSWPLHIQGTQFQPNLSHQKWCPFHPSLSSQHSLNRWWTRHHLTPSKPALIPLFYGLPKVHKPNISLRPIVVSACHSPNNQLSSSVSHFIQPLVKILLSYIQDSKHFLELLESLPHLPENATLVTAWCHITLH